MQTIPEQQWYPYHPFVLWPVARLVVTAANQTTELPVLHAELGLLLSIWPFGHFPQTNYYLVDQRHLMPVLRSDPTGVDVCPADLCMYFWILFHFAAE